MKRIIYTGAFFLIISAISVIVIGRRSEREMFEALCGSQEEQLQKAQNDAERSQIMAESSQCKANALKKLVGTNALQKMVLMALGEAVKESTSVEQAHALARSIEQLVVLMQDTMQKAQTIEEIAKASRIGFIIQGFQGPFDASLASIKDNLSAAKDSVAQAEKFTSPYMDMAEGRTPQEMFKVAQLLWQSLEPIQTNKEGKNIVQGLMGIGFSVPTIIYRATLMVEDITLQEAKDMARAAVDAIQSAAKNITQAKTLADVHAAVQKIVDEADSIDAFGTSFV